MPYYTRLGDIPSKRHTQFRKKDGTLYAEQLFSTQGFSNEYSLLYHLHPPTAIVESGTGKLIKPVAEDDQRLIPRSFEGFSIPPEKNYLDSRKVILFNQDCRIALAAPENGTGKQFVKNAGADEMIFMHEGRGILVSMYGELRFRPGDYIMIPRGTIYSIDFNTTINRLLITESFHPFRFPKKYLGKNGQLAEHAPYCERDLRIPENLKAIDEQGNFDITVIKGDYQYLITYQHHPFDVVGWDGCCYPYILSIHDFEPITGRLHQPPPVHLTFETDAFVVCSFVPRLYDYHPLSIPAPYNHSNIDSDELLYYVDGDFMSRKQVTKGMLTLHPAGIPHGPHPGTVEKSIGQRETQELAVMIDTFRPLLLTQQAKAIAHEDYYKSWLP